MAPAHAFMQTQNRNRLVARAAEVRAACAEAHDPPTDGRNAAGFLVGALLDGITTKRDVERTQFKMPGGGVCVSTFGLGLLGWPEIVIRWPADLREAALGIIRDIALECLNGVPYKQKVALGREVYAARYGVGYRVDELCPPGEDTVHHKFAVMGAKYRADDTPPFVMLSLAVDVRDDRDLPGGVPGTMAVWRKRGGVPCFTGIVQIPLPSPNWQQVDKSISFARLLDTSGDIDGPCRILSPAGFLAEIQQFDPA